MATRGERLIAGEMVAAIAVRTGDGIIRGSSLGQDRFSPSRYLSIAIAYGGLGAIASLGDTWADVASAVGGLVLLATLLSAVPTGSGQTLGTEVGAAFGNIGNPASSPS